MKIADVVALSLAGYSREDLKTLNEMAKDDAQVIDLAKTAKGMDELKELMELADEPEQTPLADPDPEQPGESDQEKDQNAKTMEDLKKENEKLAEDLRKAQEVNAAKNNQGNSAKDPLEEAYNRIIDFCAR